MADEIVRPDPDPTSRTVDLVTRDLQALEKLVNSRLDSITDAQRTFQETITRVPTDVQKAVSGLKELVEEKLATHEEKFLSIGQRFKDWNEAAVRLSLEGKTAIDAALQARKEAADKSESAIMKAIDQLQNIQNTATSALQANISDLKDRINMAEGSKSGEGGLRSQQSQSQAGVIAIILAGIAIVGLYLKLSGAP